MNTDSDEPIESAALPINLHVHCSEAVFAQRPVQFERWAPLNYLVGPNGTGKTTLFNAIMLAARSRWQNRVKILSTGRLGPLEKTVTAFIGDTTSRLFQEENIDVVYHQLFSGQDTAHQAFQLLEKRLDLQIRVLGFLRHVFKKTLHFKATRKGLQVLGAAESGSYQIIDECHGLKELITILTFLYDDTFSVLGIDEPELHLHPQFERFLLDELRAVAGNPDTPGKKLIFLVTHSPILLELRTLSDLASILVFSQSATPRRASPWEFTTEEQLKVRQALPSFHAGQRELLFSNVPVVAEGPTDVAVIMNAATKLGLPLGAAGIGVPICF
jgi:predicted ATP-dependent endonuclease of OLD family